MNWRPVGSEAVVLNFHTNMPGNENAERADSGPMETRNDSCACMVSSRICSVSGVIIAGNELSHPSLQGIHYLERGDLRPMTRENRIRLKQLRPTPNKLTQPLKSRHKAGFAILAEREGLSRVHPCTLALQAHFVRQNRQSC